jgi:GT2 family glycosyltransferase
MYSIDVIILSNGKNENLIDLTNQTIQTLISSENSDEIAFNILVIESNVSLQPFQYPNSTTIYPTSVFGFHKYLNIGVNQTQNDFICFCNNDLIFHKGWASAILTAAKKDNEIYSFGTFCPTFHNDKLNEIPNEINYGYKNGVFFTGWCFMLKREIFDIIGPFDERFIFWYADDDFRLTLQKYNLKNALIKQAKVTHLGSETLNKEKSEMQFVLQYSANAYYQYKWKHKNPILYFFQKVKYQLTFLKNKLNS